MVTSCKKGDIEDKQVKQLETHLISERKSSEVIGVNATVKKGGPLGNMTLKKKGGNWVKEMIKRGVIQDLRKVKKGVIEFKIGQQSKKGGHQGNGSLKIWAY